jgi:hypothetical protein
MSISAARMDEQQQQQEQQEQQQQQGQEQVRLPLAPPPPAPSTPAPSTPAPPPPLPHVRSMSEVSARKTKRISITLPIQPISSSGSPLFSPVLPYTPLAASIPVPPSPAEPTDSTFLTALAAHERRVLELREELVKAEHELRRLKHTWAAHEAHKKRQHDPRKLHKLQSIQASPDATDLESGAASRQLDMERRRALLTCNKTSSRTVFSGSRHARTLSLLSPDMLQQHPRHHQHPDSDQAMSRPPHPPRVHTDSDLTTEVARTADDAIELGIPREVLLKAGKQMASDFRDGLWTFIEDLRQATVGDEGINATSLRNQSQSANASRPQPTRASLKPSPKPQPLRRSATTGSRRTDSRSPAPSSATDKMAYLDIGNSFWRDNGLEEPKPRSSPVVKTSKKATAAPVKPNHVSTASLDTWENWEATVPIPISHADLRSDSSASEPQTSTSPAGTSPRTSIRFVSRLAEKEGNKG